MWDEGDFFKFSVLVERVVVKHRFHFFEEFINHVMAVAIVNGYSFYCLDFGLKVLGGRGMMDKALLIIE
jgi:hypothetical protein